MYRKEIDHLQNVHRGVRQQDVKGETGRRCTTSTRTENGLTRNRSEDEERLLTVGRAELVLGVDHHLVALVLAQVPEFERAFLGRRGAVDRDGFPRAAVAGHLVAVGRGHAYLPAAETTVKRENI